MSGIREQGRGMADFEYAMRSVGIKGISQAILRTWDEPEGFVVREVGLGIVEELRGEEYADRLYEELWEETQMRKARVA